MATGMSRAAWNHHILDPLGTDYLTRIFRQTPWASAPNRLPARG